MKHIDQLLREHNLYNRNNVDNFIETFYEKEEDNAKLKDAFQKYNDENLQRVKDKLQRPKVKQGINADEPEVIYSDLDQPLKNIFKHIIIFTGDKKLQICNEPEIC